jgi:hypothetical protein
MNEPIRPSYVSEKEWKEVLKKLPYVRSRYIRDLKSPNLKREIAIQFERILESNQFLALQILLKLRQPKNFEQSDKVKNGRRIVNDMIKVAASHKIEFS